MKRAYTLLADDTLPISSAPERERAFAAHVVYACLTNEQIVFSDNQIVNSRNLRALIDADGPVRALVKDGVAAAALRAVGGGAAGPSAVAEPGRRLRRVEEAFVSEGKLRADVASFDPSRTLDFIEAHAPILDWTYSAVRDGFTAGCERAFASDASRAAFGSERFDLIQTLIAEEKERSAAVDAGLGRQFLQVRLPEALSARGLALSPAQAEHLRDCSEGPYLSNLPRVLGLDPIYEARHRSAFDLMREASAERLEEADAPRAQRVKLSADFFIEGLLRLQADDIHRLRESAAFRSFVSRSQTTELTQSAVDDIAVAFEILMIEIEDRIIERFPELGLHTTAPAPRVLRTRWARIQTTAGLAFEMANLALTSAGLPAIPGIGQDMLITEARKQAGADEARLAASEAARRRISWRRIADALGAAGRAARMKTQHDVSAAPTAPLSYDETVVD